MTEAKAAARKRFDRWAHRYEHDRRSKANARVQSAALSALALQPDDRFLDVGCGSGAALRAASETVEYAVGVDLAPAMIERARQLALGSSDVECVVGDSEQLPFRDGTFTAVLCSSSFHHYPHPGRALEQMARVLSPNGRLVIAEPNADLRVVRSPTACFGGSMQATLTSIEAKHSRRSPRLPGSSRSRQRPLAEATSS
jgi:ubiquinone/menaquinone biosynthesis C-methylase UbiE